MRGPGYVTALVAAAVLLSALPGTAEELSVEEILSRHVEAKGGEEAWEAVDRLRIKGTYSAFGWTSPFTLLRQRPAKLRFETVTPEEETWAAGHDGELTWAIDPWLGTPWAMEMNTVEAAVFLPEADFDGPLFGPAEAGHEVELAGVEDFDGIDTYKLVVTRADGGEEEWYLDKTTFLEVARIAPAADFGRPVETGRTYFLDFRPVEGLMLPHRIEKEYSIRFRSYDVETVEVNPELGPGAFSLPRSAAMAALAPLAGEWEVKIEWPTRPGAPWAEATTTATVKEDFHGALLVADLSFERGGQPRRLRHTWSYDRFRELYLETVFDSFTLRHNLLEGTMDDGKLITSTLETGTVFDVGGGETHTRHTTSDIGPDGFEILRETTTDGGETWTENLRLTFSRPSGATPR